MVTGTITVNAAAVASSIYNGINRPINNGNIRFGDGSQNSINTSGNLLQPFYYSDLVLGWRQLTYTDRATPPNRYPLDSKFGVGGDGTSNWNTNGTLAPNPIMANQVFDSSGFNNTGIIKVKGDITVGTAQLEVINSYSIGLGDNFVKITTTAKNIGDAAITNLRYWIGTKDDYVGGTDTPTIVRGNFVDGAFQALTSLTQRASALRITTPDEGILFFTTSIRGNNSHAGYNPVSNPSELINPITALISNTIDGSYSMYVRMNDLAINESDSFTWYYAAAALDELDDVIGDVAVASSITGISSSVILGFVIFLHLIKTNIMKKIWVIMKVVLSIFLIFGGLQHFISPDNYIPFVPSFLPFTMAIIYLSGLFEVLFGVALFFKKLEILGAWGILILMLLFLPIHIWDVISNKPAIGSHNAALIRLPIQFLLIFIAWKVKNSVSQYK